MAWRERAWKGVRLGGHEAIAACPAGAITAGQFTDKQILAEIEGLLADAKPPPLAV